MLRVAKAIKWMGYAALMFLAGTCIFSLISLFGFFKHGRFETDAILFSVSGLIITASLFLIGLYKLETYLKLADHK